MNQIKTLVNNSEVAVIIPVYQEVPGPEEMNCFQNNCKLLSRYPIFLVGPEGLNVQAYNIQPGIQTEFFPSGYFKGIRGYNRLMLSKEFYQRFENYKYILICQLDVFVFKDELNFWCQLNYDYIGAPWIQRQFRILSYVAVKTGFKNALKMLFTRSISNCVGNGGFSLRKIRAFSDSLKQYKNDAVSWPANEDFYWSFFAKIEGKPLSMPDYKMASKFSIEVKPKKLLRLNNNELPMGIHAWGKYEPEVWKTILKQHGYEY